MGIDVMTLSPAAQAQIARKLEEQTRCQVLAKQTVAGQSNQRQRKYHNQPTERATASGGVIRFDSKKEARRFDELRAMEAAGMIRNLRLQQDFTLQEAYTAPNGQRVRAIRYRADFTYEEHQTGAECWVLVVEDVKSNATRTQLYINKRKMMLDRFHIAIREV